MHLANFGQYFGYTSALEESIAEYKVRIIKLEIDIADLKGDVRTLASVKLSYCTLSQN